jgi:hypothetical protein
MERHRDAFIRDSNLGLAKQAIICCLGLRLWLESTLIFFGFRHVTLFAGETFKDLRKHTSRFRFQT